MTLSRPSYLDMPCALAVIWQLGEAGQRDQPNQSVYAFWENTLSPLNLPDELLRIRKTRRYLAN